MALSNDIKFITHFAMVHSEEPMYSLPPDAYSERTSGVYPAGHIPSAPSDCSTTDVARLSQLSFKNDVHQETRSFTFSPSITLPSTVQFPATPMPSSLFVNCPSLEPSKKKPFNDFFKTNKSVKILFVSCFIFTVILILALIIYFILLVISVRKTEY